MVWVGSAYECMGVGLDVGFVVGGKGTAAALDLEPACALFAHFALVALAGFAHQVAAFVSADFLSLDLLAADPAEVLLLHLLQLHRSQFLQSQPVLAARAIDCFLHFLDLINVSWCVF